MAEYKITNIRMSDPKGGHKCVTHLYGPKLEDAAFTYVDNMLRVCGYIEAGRHLFYLEDRGKRIYVKVRIDAEGDKFLQAFTDGEWTNDLLDLRERGMDQYRIHSVRRSQPGGGHDSITHVAGPEVVKGKVDYNKPLSWIVDFLETEKYVYYVDKDGERAYAEVREADDGTKYIQIQHRGEWTDDLLALPPC